MQRIFIGQHLASRRRAPNLSGSGAGRLARFIELWAPGIGNITADESSELNLSNLSSRILGSLTCGVLILGRMLSPELY